MLCGLSRLLVESVQGMVVGKYLPPALEKIVKYYSPPKEASQVENFLEKLQRSESGTKICRLRNWYLKGHETDFFSQEQTDTIRTQIAVEHDSSANFFLVY